jgi:hypothetical protein
VLKDQIFVDAFKKKLKLIKQKENKREHLFNTGLNEKGSAKIPF